MPLDTPAFRQKLRDGGDSTADSKDDTAAGDAVTATNGAYSVTVSSAGLYWIIVDSPPVMAVTDASVVAHMVSGVMFVVSSEMTNRHAAKSAIDQLSAARARVIGAVLNRVHLERHPYYYAKYYRREYSEYYISKV